MIVSHAHEFIFLKTRKTGGTSVELALSTICGPDDVITWLGRDEKLREGRGPQNTEPDRGTLPLSLRLRLALGGNARALGAVYANHMPARPARRLIGRGAWDRYFKFSIERNPWDRQVSYYYYRCRDPKTRPDFKTWLTDPGAKARIDNFRIYGIDGKIVVDQVLRYETLSADFDAAMARIGIANPPELPHAKAKARPRKENYQSHYDDETRALVGDWYAREIAAFGYRFDGVAAMTQAEPAEAGA
ncbi:hypothetical protein GGD81_000588 [Rhodobium orientis]|nr:sulfotransferase family 2 domain-containing protein [Rhodobium orientis]MBB4301571.1 hypothetical protein [Rhodobium orientis]